MSFIGKMSFEPSFHNNLEVVITKENLSIQILPKLKPITYLEEKEKLTVQEYKQLKEYKKYNENAEKQRWIESSQLTSQDLKGIPDIFIDLVNHEELDDRMILDGIIVNCDLASNMKKGSFSFHSPESWMKSYQLTKRVIDLCFKKMKSENSIVALENVASYFDFFVPWKITNKDPFTCRISGRLSTHEQEDLNKFLSSLTKNNHITMDLSNFDGMGTRLYSSFIHFNSQVDHINWQVHKNNTWVQNQLKEIGIKESEISIV